MTRSAPRSRRARDRRRHRRWRQPRGRKVPRRRDPAPPPASSSQPSCGIQEPDSPHSTNKTGGSGSCHLEDPEIRGGEPGRPRAARIRRDRPLRVGGAGSPAVLRRQQQEADVPPVRQAVPARGETGRGCLPPPAAGTAARTGRPRRSGRSRPTIGPSPSARFLAGLAGGDGHRRAVPRAHAGPE